MHGLAYRVGCFTLEPHRQLLKDGLPVQIGRKPLELLSILAIAEGNLVTKDEMMAAVWPNVIVEENAIQAQIVALRKLLGADADLLSTVRGLGYRLVASSDKAKLQAPRQMIARAPVLARRPIAQILLATVPLIVVGVSSLWPATHRPVAAPAAPAASPPTVTGNYKFAIVPLMVRGGAADARSFANDFSDQIASVLSDNDVRVVSDRESSNPPGANAITAARDLRADLLIDGTVESDGKMLDVLVRLRDVNERVIVWSREFRGNSSSPGALRATVAAHLANVAKWGAVARSGRARLDATALADFIVGRERTTFVRSGGQGAALADYQRVVVAAPEFSWGHSGVAASAAFAALDEPSAAEAARLRNQAGREARRALALDPHNGEAYLALEEATPRADLARRETLLLQGAAADPNFDPVIMFEGHLLWDTGRSQDALGWFERGHSVDQLHAGETAWLALALASSGRVAASRALVRQMQSQWPELDRTKDVRFWALLIEGSTSQALKMMDNPATRPTYMVPVSLKAWRTALEGVIATDPAMKRKAAKSTIAAVNAGWLYAAPATLLLVMLGDLDDAVATVPLHDASPYFWPYYLFLPAAAPLRADPRFMNVAQRLGLVAYWRKTGQWPDFCSEPGLPYDCRAEAAKFPI